MDEYFKEENIVYNNADDWEVRLYRSIPNEALSEQIRFVSSAVKGSTEGTKHRFTLWHRIYN